MTIIQETNPRMIAGREYNFRQVTTVGGSTAERPGHRLSMLARCPIRTAAASQPCSLSRSPGLEFRRMRNTNGRKTASIALPTAQIAAYLVDPSANPLLRLHAVAGILGEYSVFPAVDAAKCKDIPLRLSCLHRKTPVGVGPGAFDRTIR
jgi:hypothetical protein